jgi:hypothetical protein
MDDWADSGLVVMCAIQLPMHVGTPATWRDANRPSFTVCDRHRAQYEERADEFGPYAWEPVVRSFPNNHPSQRTNPT